MDNQPQTVPVQPVSPQQEPTSPQQPVKKKSLLWLWITLSLVLVLAAAAALFFIFVYPDVQARAVATGFMNAVKADDKGTLKRLSGVTSDDSLVKSAHEGLKNATYSVSDTKNKGADGYVVNFKVESSSTLKNTSVIVKNNKVSTFLLNVGVASSDQNATDDSKDTANTELSSTCLTESNLRASDAGYIDAVALKAGAQSGSPIYFDELYFNPDSLNYVSESAANSSFTRAAALYKNASKKEYTYTLKGFQHEVGTGTSDASVAAQRAQKAKAQMTALGIPESRITILEPEVKSNTDYDEIDRRIDLGLLIPSRCEAAY